MEVHDFCFLIEHTSNLRIYQCMKFGKGREQMGCDVGFVSTLAAECHPWHEGPTSPWMLYWSLYVVGCLALITTHNDFFNHSKGISMSNHT